MAKNRVKSNRSKKKLKNRAKTKKHALKRRRGEELTFDSVDVRKNRSMSRSAGAWPWMTEYA